MNTADFLENKKGMSGVVTAIILIALVMAAVGIVWTVINNVITKKIGESEACFGIFEKVTINSEYTCYNLLSKEFRFSINIGDINVDEVLVSITGNGTSKGFKISNESKIIGNITNYPDGSSDIKLPGRNAGLTYIFNVTGGGFSGRPDIIQISPIINKNQCGVSDSFSSIDNC